MKKFNLILAALLLATGAVAQVRPQFGVKGGLNVAYEMNSDGQSTDAVFGVHAGFFMEARLSRMIDIQPELLFSMQGATDYKGNTERFNYLNVPVMFKFYTGQARRFSIDAGPQLGYMMSATVNGVNVYSLSRLKKIDASLGVGASYKFDGGLDIGIRVLVGMTPIFEGSENTHSVVNLGVGYRF
jgi:hypothetical protein